MRSFSAEQPAELLAEWLGLIWAYRRFPSNGAPPPRRRAARAGVWAAAVAVSWVVLTGALHAGPRWALVGPVAAGGVAIVLNRLRRRKTSCTPSAILREPAEKWPSG